MTNPRPIKNSLGLAKRMCLGKIKHKSMLSAEYVFYAMGRRNNNLLEIYKCPLCHYFHIGNNNKKNEDSKNTRVAKK